jgi:hypothetical protein
MTGSDIFDFIGFLAKGTSEIWTTLRVDRMFDGFSRIL